MLQQSEAARRNGARSKGPVTADRDRSSRNRLRHGLRSQQVVIPGEDPAEFDRHRAAYVHRFQPADQPEMDLVETMAAARWRLNRLLAIETRILKPALSRPAEGVLSLLLRYGARINRAYEQAFKQLQTLQCTRPPTPPAKAGRKSSNQPKLVLVPTPRADGEPGECAAHHRGSSANTRSSGKLRFSHASPSLLADAPLSTGELLHA